MPRTPPPSQTRSTESTVAFTRPPTSGSIYLRCTKNSLSQHTPEPSLVGVRAPAVTVDHPQVNLDAAEHRGRLDEFLERHVIAKPPPVAVNLEDASDLPVDPC